MTKAKLIQNSILLDSQLIRPISLTAIDTTDTSVKCLLNYEFICELTISDYNETKLIIN